MNTIEADLNGTRSVEETVRDIREIFTSTCLMASGILHDGQSFGGEVSAMPYGQMIVTSDGEDLTLKLSDIATLSFHHFGRPEGLCN